MIHLLPHADNSRVAYDRTNFGSSSAQGVGQHVTGEGLKGSICSSSLAHWKARSRLPIGEHFLLVLMAKALRVKIRQNRPLLKGWVSLGLNIRLKGTFTANIYSLCH